MNYYNEFDHNAAEWLRELIAAELIPAGEVDERSITDVGADELREYTQCHFFAGIGGWSLALRLAGWPDDRPVWTGSCPCQCFSAAGKQRGFADDRDLWPVFANLIAKCRPEFVFGEQVENAIKHGWLDRVYADLEAEGYAVGAAVLGAHSLGAPHRRQRLYWGGSLSLSNFERQQRQRGARGCESIVAEGGIGTPAKFARYGDFDRMAENSDGGRCGRRDNGNPSGNDGKIQVAGLRNVVWMADCADHGRDGSLPGAGRTVSGGECRGMCKSSGACNGGGMDDTESDGREVYNAKNVRQADGKINASANADGCGDRMAHSQGDGRLAWRPEPDGRGAASGCLRGSVADDPVVGVPSGVSGQNARKEGGPGELVHDHSNYGLADCGSAGLEGRHGEQRADQLLPRPSGLASLSPWARYRLVYCRDKKIRRIPAESLFLRLADGVSEGVDAGGTCGISEIGGFPLTTQKEGRAMLLKGYGNAIVPQDAAEFVSAFTFCTMK